MICLLAWGFGVDVAEHGKTKTKVENAWISLISVAIMVGLLYAGGFFN